MPYVLNVLYVALLVAVSPFLLYSAIRHGKYRSGWKQKLLGLAPPRKAANGNGPCIWLHAVSVGEVNLLATLLPRLEAAYPGAAFFISTTTATGFELAAKKYAAHTVFYCPLDFSWAVNRALDRVRPDLLLLTELELWPNLITLARRRGVKTAVVNGRLSAKSFAGYRRLGGFARWLLSQLDLIAVQNDEYAARFRQLGAPAERVCVTGSVKFDGAATNRNNPRTTALKQLAGITAGDTVFLAGSTQHPEEAFALTTFQAAAQEHPRLRLILVPRHPERFEEVARLLAASGEPWQRRSELEAESSLENAAPRILLVDTIGELGAWWGAADIAYVGGSMGKRGGQNMIEPAAYGAAVSFGPKTRNFRDVVALLRSHDAAVVVRDQQDLTDFVTLCLQNPAHASRLGAAAREVVQQQAGAAARTIDHVQQLLPSSLLPSSSARRAA